MSSSWVLLLESMLVMTWSQMESTFLLLMTLSRTSETLPSNLFSATATWNVTLTSFYKLFIVVTLKYNVYSTYSNTYINILAGVEMLQYFKYTNTVFVSTVFDRFDEADALQFVVYIMFLCCVMVSLLKLIYEMNLQFNVFTHLVTLLHEFINLAIVVLITI